MGAKHPQEVINASGATKYDLIVACNYLIRTGVVKKPADAIRYIEQYNIKIEDLMEEMTAPPEREEIEEI